MIWQVLIYNLSSDTYQGLSEFPIVYNNDEPPHRQLARYIFDILYSGKFLWVSFFADGGSLQFHGSNFHAHTHSCPLCTVQSSLFHGFNFGGQAIIHETVKIGPLKNFPLYGTFPPRLHYQECVASIIIVQTAFSISDVIDDRYDCLGCCASMIYSVYQDWKQCIIGGGGACELRYYGALFRKISE